jgi:hypothetical protein
MRFGSSADGSGIFGLIVAMLVACEAVTLVTDSYGHWLIVLLGIAVGLMAAKSINR